MVPDCTILIENPIAVTTRAKQAAAAAGAGFPEPSGLFTIKDLGGWPDVNKKVLDKDAGIVAEIERKVGVSVAS